MNDLAVQKRVDTDSVWQFISSAFPILRKILQKAYWWPSLEVPLLFLAVLFSHMAAVCMYSIFHDATALRLYNVDQQAGVMRKSGQKAEDETESQEKQK